MLWRLLTALALLAGLASCGKPIDPSCPYASPECVDCLRAECSAETAACYGDGWGAGDICDGVVNRHETVMVNGETVEVFTPPAACKDAPIGLDLEYQAFLECQSQCEACHPSDLGASPARR